MAGPDCCDMSGGMRAVSLWLLSAFRKMSKIPCFSSQSLSSFFHCILLRTLCSSSWPWAHVGLHGFLCSVLVDWLSGERKKIPRFAAFANFCDVTTPIVADFKLRKKSLKAELGRNTTYGFLQTLPPSPSEAVQRSS